MPTINEIVPEMDLACRKPLEVIRHTWHLKKPSKCYMYAIFMAAIFDFYFCVFPEKKCKFVHLGFIPEYM